MARYSTFKYGSGQEYRTLPLNANLMWTFMVDWTSEGYDGSNEAERMIDLVVSRGRDYLISPDGNGWERYNTGEFTAVLENLDGKYDPWNTSSPLYPHILSGKFFRLLVKDSNTGTNYPVMRGKITDIQPFVRGTERFVRITGKDGLETLGRQIINIEKKENFTFGLNVKTILDNSSIDDVEWPYSTNNNGNIIPFTWFSEKTALESIHELEDSEFGTFRQRRNGTFFWSARTTGITTTTVVTETQILKDISVLQPWEVVVNQAKMVLNPLTSHNITAIIWELENGPITILAGESYTVEIAFRHPTLSIPIVGDNLEPISPDINVNSDGSGAFLPFSTEITNIGETAILTITNDDPSTTGFLVSCEITGDAIYAQYKSVLSAEDTTSQALYGKRTLTIKTPWMQRSDICQNRVNDLVDNLKDPIPLPTIQIENRPSIQFALDLFEHGIKLELDSWGLDEVYRIGKIEHRWLNDNGQAVRTTYKLEPVLTFT